MQTTPMPFAGSTLPVDQTQYDSTTAAYAGHEKAHLGPVDIGIIVAYIAVTFAVGIWASCGGTRSIKSYFLAGQTMTWIPVGASLFASNIGSGHFIGLAGAGAAGGIAIGSFEWLAPYILIQLGWLFLPIYKACQVYTMPEYLNRRFGGSRLRVTLSVISLALYVLTKIAVDLYAGALFIQQAFSINLYLAIVSLLVITAIYTILGGLKAVIYTDTMQTLVMLIGGMLLMVISFMKIGSYDDLKASYMNAIPNTTKAILNAGNTTSCGMPREDSFHMFRDPVSSDLPWPAMLSGIYFLGSWYWCTDQVIVQRSLAAKNSNHAKAACVLAGILKILPVYMIVITGMISRVLFADEVACADPIQCEEICGNAQGCSNIAYPKLVLELLPNGLRGIMVAAMLSALMSSLTSIFNSTSTIFTIDVWKRIRKTASEKEMLIVGKLTICVLVIISILWIPILLSSAGGQLFLYLQSIQSALGPPIFVLYLFAILWPRINECGAFWGLISGFSVGVLRLILDFAYGTPGCDEEDRRPQILNKVNYLYVAPIVFLISSVVTIFVSYLTEPLSQKQLEYATWFTIPQNGTKARTSTNCEKEEKTTKDENVAKEKNSAKEKNAAKVEETELKEDANAECAEAEKTENGEVEEGAAGEKTADSAIVEISADDKAQNQPTEASKQSEILTWEFFIDAMAVATSIGVTFLMGYYA